MLQAQEVAVLRSDLEAERDAHEGTLRDAEAAMIELEALKGRAGDSGAAEAVAAVQTELRAARQKCSVAQVGSERCFLCMPPPWRPSSYGGISIYIKYICMAMPSSLP